MEYNDVILPYRFSPDLKIRVTAPKIALIRARRLGRKSTTTTATKPNIR
jgi:hypothetical protein